jgi:hypothetical protein
VAPDVPALNRARKCDSPVHSAKGTPWHAAEPIVLRLLVDDGFQVLFHSPPGVLFTFPSRYWFAIGGQEYLALEGGPPGFPQGFSCPGVLGWQSSAATRSATGLSPSLVRLSSRVRVVSRFLTDWSVCRRSGLLPQPAKRNADRLDTLYVWAPPLSLAATHGISVDFSSSGYLDVSVPPLTFPT